MTEKLVSCFALALAFCTPSWGGELSDVERATFLVIVGDKDNKVMGSGSGFLITSQGHVVTNAHVIDGAENILLLGSGLTQGGLRARTIWTDEELDLAIVKTEEDVSLVQPLSVFSEAASQATDVYSYGYPNTQFEHMRALSRIDLHGPPTTTKGIISRSFQTQTEGLLIQHSAEMRFGNSGGPLVNGCGQVVGINVAIRLASEDEGGGKDNFAVSSTELIEQMGSRIPGMFFSESCDLDSSIVRPSARTQRSASPSTITESNTQVLLLAVAFLVSIAVIMLNVQRSRKKYIHLGNFHAETDLPSTVLPGPALLLKLSGFDQQGTPLSLSINDGNILERRGYVLGRSTAFSDLAINHQRLSRAHLWITRERGLVFAADLNSTNGTFLNGKKLKAFTRESIAAGDEIRLADIVLTVSK